MNFVRFSKKSCICFLFLFIINSISAQNDTLQNKYKIGSDIVSRYVWRGSDYFNSPAVQPDIQYFVYKNIFSIGAWGSFSIANQPIQETDLYANLNVQNFTIFVYDYFFMNFLSNNNYFDYKASTTGHTFSIDVSYTISEKHPLTILASYNFWGNDSLRSTYFELSYELKRKQIMFFCGGTLNKGWYAEKAGICNVGITALRELKITNSFTIPLKLNLIVNPISENIYIVAGISL